MLKHRKFCIYCVIWTAYLLILNLLLAAEDSSQQWSGFSDKAYVLLFSPFLMIGCGMNDGRFRAVSVIRFPDRRKALLVHVGYQAVFGIVSVSVWFLFALIGGLLLRGTGYVGDVGFFINQYFRHLLATLLLVNLSLCFFYSELPGIRKSPQFAAFGLLLADILVLQEMFNRNLGLFEPLLFFSWMYAKQAAVSYAVLAGFNVLLLAVLCRLGRRKDWLR